MALRDTSLDEKITAAAWREFSAKGYTGASLRKIAEQAGVTVGAIQTRYPSKDALFVSLVQPLLTDAAATFLSVKADYYADVPGSLLDQLKSSMRAESAEILRVIFAHYDEAILLFERSAGSSIAGFYDGLVQRKISESAAFFRAKGEPVVDDKLLGMLISLQFDTYRRIVREYPDRAEAQRTMNALMTYHFAGWTAIFDAAKKENAQ